MVFFSFSEYCLCLSLDSLGYTCLEFGLFMFFMMVMFFRLIHSLTVLSSFYTHTEIPLL